MDTSAISLLPPALTLFIGFATRNIKWALSVGLGTAALIATNYHPVKSAKLLAHHMISVTEMDHFLSWNAFCGSEKLFIFIFLLVLGMVIAMIERSGDAKAYAQVLKHKLSSKWAAQKATLSFSMALFVDDYLNVITTTSIMPMMTDLFGIPRIKIAYLVVALAAPLCTLIPISSWGAPIGLFISNAGIAKTGNFVQIAYDPFLALAGSIPFIFQGILMILSGWTIVALGISYGIIGHHEKTATADVNEIEKNELMPSHEHSFPILVRLLSPLLIMFATILTTIFYTGGAWIFGGSNTLLASFLDANLPVSMVTGAVVALAVTLTIFIANQKRSVSDALKACRSGLSDMSDSIIVLTLAWTFAEFLNGELGTGQYLAFKLVPVLSISLLPLAIFCLGTLMSFALGSSWATMSILFPIVIPMIPTLMNMPPPLSAAATPIMYPLIGAIISGGLAGSSISPMADLLLMASKTTKIDHMEYVKAQMQYIFPSIISTGLAFLVAGMTTNTYSYSTVLALSMTTGACANLLILLSLSFVWNRLQKA